MVSDGRGGRVRDGGLARWLTRVAPARLRGEVAVALVTDARVRTLNKNYRGADVATDVLSFLSSESPSRQPRVPNPGSRRFRPEPGAAIPAVPDPGSRLPAPGLGDIVIATGVAARQAREAGHSLQTELRVLALHGLLHLLGYDHEDRKDGGRMARAEARLRRRGGLPSGLIARSA